MSGETPYWDWRTKGGCAKLSTQQVEKLFFPTNGRTIKRARDFCENTCEVYQRCLEWAVHPDQAKEKGIIAGLTEKDRRAIHKIAVGTGKTNSGSFTKKKVSRRINFTVT